MSLPRASVGRSSGSAVVCRQGAVWEVEPHRAQVCGRPADRVRPGEPPARPTGECLWSDRAEAGLEQALEAQSPPAELDRRHVQRIGALPRPVIALGKKHAPLDVEILDRRRRQARAELLEELADLRSRPADVKLGYRSPHAAVDAVAFQAAQCQMLDEVAKPRGRQGLVAVSDPKTIPASSSSSSPSPVSRRTPSRVREDRIHSGMASISDNGMTTLSYGPPSPTDHAAGASTSSIATGAA